MPLSQRLKLCDNTFLLFSHLMTFDLIIDLNNDLSFGKHKILKEDMFLAYFVKHLQQNAFFLSKA